MQVFIVKKNADFTEGRGPMLFHSVWLDGEDAIRWVSQQSGIYGSQQSVKRGEHGRYAYANGYEINAVDVIESYDDFAVKEQNKAREAALMKLSPVERKLLGLE